jgi:hypothetical protein
LLRQFVLFALQTPALLCAQGIPFRGSAPNIKMDLAL